jgi:cardiolipin synthase
MDTSTPPAAEAAGRRLLTVPNVLSILRLGSVPVFVWLFVSGHEEAAVLVYAVGAWTDFFDGYIARRMGQITELGKLLDPLADRVFIVALAIALLVRDTLPLWLALVVIARDVIVLSLFPALERRGMPRLPVNFMGKCATASLLLGLTLLAWSETTFPLSPGSEPAGMAFTVGGAALYWGAAALYGREAARRMRALRDTRVVE